MRGDAKWGSIARARPGAALAWMRTKEAHAQAGPATTKHTQSPPGISVKPQTGPLVGYYESVAASWTTVAAVPDTAGVLLVFDEFVQGVRNFGPAYSQDEAPGPMSQPRPTVPSEGAGSSARPAESCDQPAQTA